MCSTGRADTSAADGTLTADLRRASSDARRDGCGLGSGEETTTHGGEDSTFFFFLSSPMDSSLFLGLGTVAGPMGLLDGAGGDGLGGAETVFSACVCLALDPLKQQGREGEGDEGGKQ